MNKKQIYALVSVAMFSLAACATTPSSARQKYSVFVDSDGVMRRSDSKEEVSYYGTNYTVPFAHAYRALCRLGIDRKEAIRRDVYHMARLGINAFRLHLWEAEICDAQGNILENEHLDLLDFLIAELEKRGIDIVLTAQTNFGNGYPEKNTDTGAFTYDFDKCKIHEDPKAQRIQENYLKQLASHTNPYTGLSYGKDRAIIAIEVNNEPCHSGSKKQVTAYINRMVKALRRGGFDKPVIYNVSHNSEVTSAYYDADIQGTTFQWYPTGLVAGHKRTGNFLPYVDQYIIPWKDSIKNYGKFARFVYEFDPGDVLVSDLYPAIVRTLRKEGFQWITQFAYDPTDMARFNTEYQTHFLNLAYTPAKALSMAIAAEAAQEVPRGADFGKYPDNTRFGHTLLSEKGTALYNSPLKYICTGEFSDTPADIDSLELVAGVGNNAVVKYNGTGAYFLDRLDSGHWRLEVMPDVVLTEDPFRKPSLSREVGQIVYTSHPMTINIPSLGNDFFFTALNQGNTRSGRASGASIDIYPGVYLLSRDTPEPGKWTATTPFGPSRAASPLGNMYLGEYAAPKPSDSGIHLTSTPKPRISTDSPLPIHAIAISPEGVDSVVMYPAEASFWRNDNKLYPLANNCDKPYEWSALLKAPHHTGKYSYRLVAYSAGKPVSFPGAIPGTPLDWDFPEDAPLYTTDITESDTPLPVILPSQPYIAIEAGAIPYNQGAWLQTLPASISRPEMYKLEFTPEESGIRAVIRADFPDIPSLDTRFNTRKELYILLGDKPECVENMEIGLVDKRGISFTTTIHSDNLTLRPDGMYEATVPLHSLKQTATWLLPAAYPAFLTQCFNSAVSGKTLKLDEICGAVITLPDLQKDTRVRLLLRAMLLK